MQQATCHDIPVRDNREFVRESVRWDEGVGPAATLLRVLLQDARHRSVTRMKRSGRKLLTRRQ